MVLQIFSYKGSFSSYKRAEKTSNSTKRVALVCYRLENMLKSQD